MGSITHTKVTNAPADLTALVDGPAWDAAHTFSLSASDISGLAASATTDTTSAANITSGVLASSNGGTGINNGGRNLTINTNSGTLAFGAASKTLTVNNSIAL